MIEAWQLHWMWRETNNRLDVLSRRVDEGRDVVAASEFVRWLGFSGVLRILELNPSIGVLRVDGGLLRFKADDILRRCNACGVVDPDDMRLGLDAVRSIHEKLDLIAGHVSRSYEQGY